MMNAGCSNNEGISVDLLLSWCYYLLNGLLVRSVVVYPQHHCTGHGMFSKKLVQRIILSVIFLVRNIRCQCVDQRANMQQHQEHVSDMLGEAQNMVRYRANIIPQSMNFCLYSLYLAWSKELKNALKVKIVNFVVVGTSLVHSTYTKCPF